MSLVILILAAGAAIACFIAAIACFFVAKSCFSEADAGQAPVAREADPLTLKSGGMERPVNTHFPYPAISQEAVRRAYARVAAKEQV